MIDRTTANHPIPAARIDIRQDSKGKFGGILSPEYQPHVIKPNFVSKGPSSNPAIAAKKKICTAKVIRICPLLAPRLVIIAISLWELFTSIAAMRINVKITNKNAWELSKYITILEVDK